MTIQILVGDVRERLRTLADNSIHCCVTSPPYWGLRDYGTASWEGGDAECTHSLIRLHADPKNPAAPTQNGRARKGEELNRQVCRCGAKRIDSQIGLEASPGEFIETMVAVFEEVRRVLRPDGTCWINMGDSYAGNRGSSHGPTIGQKHRTASGDAQHQMTASRRRDNEQVPRSDVRVPGLKPKDLVMMPHRLAIALQEAGWWVRQDIVWHKPNPMPESTRDRCTKAHEYVFLLTKSERYYYDQDAIRTEFAEKTTSLSFATMDGDRRKKYKKPDGWDTGTGGHGTIHRAGREKGEQAPDDYVPPAGANKRSVWTIATSAYPEAHFATFPPELPETCIKAGCPPGGMVLDPFFGAGTTGLVADRLQRDCIGIELNPKYAELARRRIQQESTLFAQIEVA